MSKSPGQYTRKTVEVKAVHSNLHQEVIQITEDKLRLVLSDHLAVIEQKKSWIAPLGIFLTLILVFVTAEFKKFYFSPSTWEAFFLMATLLTLLWLCKSAYIALNAKTIDDVVSCIKNEQATEEESSSA